MRQNQDWFARLFSIRQQFTAGVIALLAVLLVTAATFAYGLHSVLEHARWLARANEAAATLSRLDQKINGELAAEGIGETALSRGQLALLSSVADDLGRLSGLLGEDGAQAARLRQMQEAIDYWRGRDGKSGLRARLRLSSANTTSALDQLQLLMKELTRAHSQMVTEHARRAESVYLATWLQAGIVLLLSVTFAFVFSRRLAGRVVDPVQQMMLAAERLTLGEVAPRVEDTQRDEVGQLARAFNRMAAHVSEREAATLARNRELDDLHYFNTMLQTSSSEEEIHRALLQKARAFDVSQAVILNRYALENSLTIVASLHPLSPHDLGEGHSVSPAITDNPDLMLAASTPLCRVVRAGREVTVPDIADDLMCLDCRFGQQRGSSFCVPITAGGQTIGAFHLASPQTGYWTGERQRLVKAFVDQAAPAINNLRLMEQMRNRALVDEQTQVYNRRFLDGYLRKQVASAERQGLPLSVMMIDIDYFKRFNDLYGHEAGDTVLRQFARAISGALREGELVARYGGEEFTVVVNGTARDALTLAERLRRAVADLSFAQFTKNGEDVRITMSIGLAEFPTSGHTPEEILKAADVALYRAKEAGRNCVKVASRTLLTVKAGVRR